MANCLEYFMCNVHIWQANVSRVFMSHKLDPIAAMLAVRVGSLSQYFVFQSCVIKWIYLRVRKGTIALQYYVIFNMKFLANFRRPYVI